MTKIKICGITNKADAINAADLGVDMLGFVFYAKSKRYVEPKIAADIANELPPSILKIGVFVNEKEDSVLETASYAQLDMLQFHGDETPEFCGKFKDQYKVIKAFRIRDKKDLKIVNDYDVDLCLFDTFNSDTIGGTGTVFDWSILKDFEIMKPVMLSGGLNPKNVARAIKELAPYAVDVSSGVESLPGKKDLKLMKDFVQNVRNAD